MRILLVDNYDSFTYNLLHYLEGESGTMVDVVRNDELSGINTDQYSHIVISPGPGLPSESGDLMNFIEVNKQKNILGVCLGQQALAVAFGMQLKQLKKVVHGRSSLINILQEGKIFKGLPKSFKVGRYHSWVIDNSTISDDFEVLAVDGYSNTMAIRHKILNLEAVQFHPESILTEHGREMIRNWIS